MRRGFCFVMQQSNRENFGRPLGRFPIEYGRGFRILLRDINRQSNRGFI